MWSSLRSRITEQIEFSSQVSPITNSRSKIFRVIEDYSFIGNEILCRSKIFPEVGTSSNIMSEDEW